MLAKYPLPRNLPDSDDATFQGIGPHKDSSFLTFLFQGTAHTGLEVQNKSGRWILVPPIPFTHGTIAIPMAGRWALASRFPYFQVLGLDLTPETATIPIPAHIATLVKNGKAKSDAEAYFQLYYKNGIGRGVLSRYPLPFHKYLRPEGLMKTRRPEEVGKRSSDPIANVGVQLSIS